MANPIFADLPMTVFEEMSGLARDLGAINLGQGFPDAPGPLAVRQAAAKAVLDGNNQYPPMAGLPELRAAVAAHYGRTQGLQLDWRTEVTVTSGATEALAAAFLALIELGDEVVVFQPAYDAYLPLIRRAGGVPVLLRLTPPDWRIDFGALEAAISPQTRFLVLNNPMNPTATVMGEADLARLAQVCVAHDLIAICDEVWEEVVLDGLAHRPLMAFPGANARSRSVPRARCSASLAGRSGSPAPPRH